MKRLLTLWGSALILGVLYTLNLSYNWLTFPEIISWKHFISWGFVVASMVMALIFHRSRLFFLLLLLLGLSVQIELLDMWRHASISPLIVHHFGTYIDGWLATLLPWIILGIAQLKDRGIFTRQGTTILGLLVAVWSTFFFSFYYHLAWMKLLFGFHILLFSPFIEPNFMWISWSILALLVGIRYLLGHTIEAIYLLLTLGVVTFSLLTRTVDMFIVGIAMLALLSMIYIISRSYYMAYIDELTQLKGRRAMNEYLLRLKSTYTIVMADIDHFKRFNDTHGHDVGDEVLKLVATELSKIKGGAEVFRWGGEEFALIFNGQNRAYALPFVETVREAISKQPFVLRASSRPAQKPKNPSKSKSSQVLHVTMSFGMATRSKSTQTPTQTMKQADEKLYLAKQEGRNCVR